MQSSARTRVETLEVDSSTPAIGASIEQNIDVTGLGVPTVTFFAASVLLWTFIGLLEAGPAYYQSLVGSEYEGAGLNLLRTLARWYTWGLFAPVIFWLARRHPLDAGLWRPFLQVHLPASLLATALHITLWILLRWFFYPPEGVSFVTLAQTYFRGYLAFNLLAYWAILGAAYTAGALRRLAAKDLREARLQLEATRLEAQLTEARLAALNAQLQPHFLFNTFNTISELVHHDPSVAERMIVGLGDMLRVVMEHNGQSDVTLRDELDMASTYLAIERERLGDRLTVEVTVPPSLYDARVPFLLLQPLVENAIRHGIQPAAGPQRLSVSASATHGTLYLVVEDTGAGPPLHLQERVGLGATRHRLAELYPDVSSLTLEPRRESGTTVTVILPLRFEDADLANSRPQLRGAV